LTLPHQHLIWLGLAVLVGVVNLLWASMAAQPQRGAEWNIGPRDEPRPLTGRAGRLERAFANFRETFPFFVAVVLAAYLAAQLNYVTLIATITYVVARAVYVPLYAFGVPYARSLVWMISLISILVILAALFL
jgi:uncharacterized MAPEG superfamily protein